MPRPNIPPDVPLVRLPSPLGVGAHREAMWAEVGVMWESAEQDPHPIIASRPAMIDLPLAGGGLECMAPSPTNLLRCLTILDAEIFHNTLRSFVNYRQRLQHGTVSPTCAFSNRRRSPQPSFS
jgi:hypothetical protein